LPSCRESARRLRGGWGVTNISGSLLFAMLWTVLLFANGTVLLLFNATFAGVVANVSLPAPPLAKPYVALDGVPVPYLFEGDRVVMPLGGGGVVTVKYVPKLGELDGFLYFNLRRTSS